MVLKNDSAQTLSRQFSFLLMLCLTDGHSSHSFSRKEAAQYRAPLPE
jgi:hypothetical protein